MKDTQSINLPVKLLRAAAKAARRNHMTLSEYVRKAIEDKLWEDAFDETRHKLVPRAEAMGIYKDEDVFKRVS
jgi:macrodomain Ter protein organizer (MatP/YcbG family)